MPTFDCSTLGGCSPAPSNSFQVIGLGQFDVGAYTNAPIVDIASGVAGRYGGDHVDLCGCKSHGPKVGAHRNPDVFQHVVVFLNGGRVGIIVRCHSCGFSSVGTGSKKFGQRAGHEIRFARRTADFHAVVHTTNWLGVLMHSEASAASISLNPIALEQVPGNTGIST